MIGRECWVCLLAVVGLVSWWGWAKRALGATPQDGHSPKATTRPLHLSWLCFGLGLLALAPRFVTDVQQAASWRPAHSANPGLIRNLATSLQVVEEMRARFHQFIPCSQKLPVQTTDLSRQSVQEMAILGVEFVSPFLLVNPNLRLLEDCTVLRTTEPVIPSFYYFSPSVPGPVFEYFFSTTPLV